MSDSELTGHQPAFPPLEQNNLPTNEDSSPAEGTETEASGTPQSQSYEIQGQTYTEDQIREWMEGHMRQADYTRKTQELAGMRREAEAKESEYLEKLRQLEEERNELLSHRSEPQDEWQDEGSKRMESALRNVTSRIDKLTEAFQRREQRDQETIERIQAEEALEVALDEFQGAPFFNRDEMKQWMQINNLGPQQARVAYNSLYGAKIGQNYGHMQAQKQGATAPPVMGYGQSSISPGFTHPSEVPGSTVDIGKTSWKDLARMAAEDEGIPGA